MLKVRCSQSFIKVIIITSGKYGKFSGKYYCDSTNETRNNDGIFCYNSGTVGIVRPSRLYKTIYHADAIVVMFLDMSRTG